MDICHKIGLKRPINDTFAGDNIGFCDEIEYIFMVP